MMQAITIAPGRPGTPQLEEIGEPPARHGPVLVRTLAVGVCGTDRELIDGRRGAAPPGQPRLVLGHESLGQVLEAPEGSGFVPGELVCGIVRHPDPVPCTSCAVGEWDMCRNGRYTERGIKEADGFASQRFRSDPGFLVKLSPALGLCGVLLEPASVIAKAWEQVDRIGQRARASPRSLLVAGAGPIGLLGALLGVQRDLEVHLYDRNPSGPKPELARRLGAHYHTRFPTLEFDIVLECTGAPPVVAQAVAASAPAGVVCLTGLGPRHSAASFDAAALNQSLVLGNRVLFGSVNANRRHYEAAAHALARAERGWLERLVTRKLPLRRFETAYAREKQQVKTVIVFED